MCIEGYSAEKENLACECVDFWLNTFYNIGWKLQACFIFTQSSGSYQNWNYKVTLIDPLTCTNLSPRFLYTLVHFCRSSCILYVKLYIYPHTCTFIHILVYLIGYLYISNVLVFVYTFVRTHTHLIRILVHFYAYLYNLHRVTYVLLIIVYLNVYLYANI